VISVYVSEQLTSNI